MIASDFSKLAAVIFGIVSILQLIRAVSGASATIGSTHVPIWASCVAFVVAGVLAYLGFSVEPG